MVVGNNNNTICLYCNKHLKGGGITRLKYHLARIKGEVDPCNKVLQDERRQRVRNETGCGSSIDEYDKDNPLSPPSIGNDQSKGKSSAVEDRNKKMKKSSNFFTPRTTPGAQPSIRSAMASKEMVEQARMTVAQWWCDANVPFNGSLSKYYQPMINAVLAVGPGFKGPFYHDLRSSLLNNNIREVREYLFEIQKSWRTNGCTIMSNGWSSRKQLIVINVITYYPKGTMFLTSIDASGLIKDADTLLDIFNDVVQHVGLSNIVQFVTNNESAYNMARKRLQEKNISRRKDALDPISLDNIDVMEYWLCEELALLDGDDLGWETIEPPLLETLTLEDPESYFDDVDVNLPNENESQYDWGICKIVLWRRQ
ncbi:hypothetical protein ACSBR1_027044 [Camellia fascicularis]